MSNSKLARVLGVSEATISRVMNNQPGVSQATARRVREAAEKLGLANRGRWAQARGLKFNCFGMLVLSGDAGQAYSWAYHQTIAGVEDALRSYNIEMIYARTVEPSQLPRRIISQQVDGIILAGTHPDPVTLSSFGDLPIVWVCSHHERDQDTALAGNDSVAQIACDYLIGRGHKVLAAINPLSSHPAVTARMEFFEFFALRRGVQAHVFNFDVDDTDVAQPPAEDDPLRRLALVVDRQVEQMLKLPHRPLGVFAATDMVAALMYPALLKRGVQPGKDIDLIGCDNDQPVLAGLYPRPATIDIAPFTMGRRAVEQLLWRIGHPDEEPRVRVVVEPVLIEGTS